MRLFAKITFVAWVLILLMFLGANLPNGAVNNPCSLKDEIGVKVVVVFPQCRNYSERWLGLGVLLGPAILLYCALKPHITTTIKTTK
jgi:hypothetical protein